MAECCLADFFRPKSVRPNSLRPRIFFGPGLTVLVLTSNKDDRGDEDDKDDKDENDDKDDFMKIRANLFLTCHYASQCCFSAATVFVQSSDCKSSPENAIPCRDETCFIFYGTSITTFIEGEFEGQPDVWHACKQGE